MAQKIGYVALVVRDYDEAIAYFTGVLGLELVEDSDLGGGKRWVLVRPPGDGGTSLLLAKAVGREQRAASATRRAAASFCFCTPTISGVIMKSCAGAAFAFWSSHAGKPMASSLFSRICMVTNGIYCN